MESKQLFEALLHAEDEDEVEKLLLTAGYINNDQYWQPVGGVENNIGTIGNQQSEATAALVEKLVNGIDATLMVECYKRGINPEGLDAPKNMTAAVEQFFNVKGGRLESLNPGDRTKLAELVQLVAVGSKETPSYLVIDHGEGQTPMSFPDTLLSLSRSNRLRVPFVQGKFNMGGTGVLPFCGNRRFELIVSKRYPGAPLTKQDDTANYWGFTLVRRMLPSVGHPRASLYAYLCPGGNILKFTADAIKVLPGTSSKNNPASPYVGDLEYGTCIKLYNYKWRAKSTATTEARYELENYLISPCLPFRVTETRDYTANYYSTTITGVSAILNADIGEESARTEPGFPASGELNLKIGKLPYTIVVFKEEVVTRRVPHGIFYIFNGQVHGRLSPEFISRRLKFDYIKNHLLVSVDCTQMDTIASEDFLMGSRDRIRQNEISKLIEDALEEELRDHPGLRALNAARRKKKIESALEDERDTVEVFQQIIKADPSLTGLFSFGMHLITTTGPGEPPKLDLRKFPTYFRLAKEPKDGLKKACPINRTCRVEFETDAENEYFTRIDSPGKIEFTPDYVCEHWNLWNGKLSARLKLPDNSKPGDHIHIVVTVSDVRCEAVEQPFVCKLTLCAEKADYSSHSGSETRKPVGPKGNDVKTGPRLAIPHIEEVRKDKWNEMEPPFNEYIPLRIQHDDKDGYDFYLNVDNAFLLTELTRTKDEDKPLVKYWFKFGLVICAIGMIQQLRINNPEEDLRNLESTENGKSDDLIKNDHLEIVNSVVAGLARVIIPVIRNLKRAPEN